jgi:GNAT superfamily N-acetyltransferase
VRNRASRLAVPSGAWIGSSAPGVWTAIAGVAEALIDACRKECAGRGVRRLSWQTAPENSRAHAVYERIGATRERWVDYWLATDQARQPPS